MSESAFDSIPHAELPAGSGRPIIYCEDVHKWYGHFHALRGVHMHVYKGEVIVIFGPSGSGKSTFIRTLNRLEEHQRGRIVVDGIELTHDVLCSVVASSRDLRHEREARDEAERQLAAQRDREAATRRRPSARRCSCHC